MGKIPNFTDSERLKTLKTNCVLKVYKDKEFYQLAKLDSRFVNLESTEERATLTRTEALQVSIEAPSRPIVKFMLPWLIIQM